MRLFQQIEHATRSGRDSTIRANENAARIGNPPAMTAQKKLDQQLNGRAAVQSQMQLRDALNQRPAVVAQRKLAAALSGRAAIQREEIPDEDDLMQQKAAETTQREEMQDDEELLQGQFTPEQREVMPDEDDEILQGKFETVQRQGLDSGTLEEPEDDEVLQERRAIAQRRETDDDDLVQTTRNPVQRQEINQTGLPDQLKAGVESLSGLAMDDVRVHYNSPQPKQLQALAYAQGTDIHVAPGEERHLPHEAWHVAQQKQGRVQPTMQAKGVAINDDAALESEADRLGARAAAMQFYSEPKRNRG